MKICIQSLACVQPISDQYFQYGIFRSQVGLSCYMT